MMNRFAALIVGSFVALASATAQQPVPAPSPAATVAPPAKNKPAGKPCILDFEGSLGNDVTRMTLLKQPSGQNNLFVGGRVIGHCRDQDVTVKADSAEYYGDQSLLYLIGNVHYIETRIKLDADRATYQTDQGHLHAEGNVYAVTNTGNTMRGPVADYYRAVEGLRAQPMMYATGRPTIGLAQKDSTGKVGDTVHVVADRITSIDSNLVYAGGAVRITRPDIIATGDSAYVDNTTGRAQLLIAPQVQGKNEERPFTLTGGLIDLFSTNKEVDRIVATPNGHVVSEDMELFADSIDMRVHDKLLQRAIAWGKSGARAVSPDRTVIADSIDALLPNQHIYQLHAVRSAYMTSIPDTLTIKTTDRDWLKGDTIIAVFDTSAAARNDTTHERRVAATAPAKGAAVSKAKPAAKAVAKATDSASASAVDMNVTSRAAAAPAKRDSSKTPPIKSLRASQNAYAYYHMANKDKIKDKPGVNYVHGRIIDLAFEDRAVSNVTVLDQASGVYLEAITDTTKKAEPKVVKPRQPAARAPRGFPRR